MYYILYEYITHTKACTHVQLLALKQAKLWAEKDKYKRIIEVETSIKRDRAKRRALVRPKPHAHKPKPRA